MDYGVPFYIKKTTILIHISSLIWPTIYKIRLTFELSAN